MTTITAIQHKSQYQPTIGYPVWHTVADASVAAKVSETAIRRAIRRDCAVRRISGATVAGMIELCVGSVTGYIPYAN